MDPAFDVHVSDEYGQMPRTPLYCAAQAGQHQPGHRCANTACRGCVPPVPNYGALSEVNYRDPLFDLKDKWNFWDPSLRHPSTPLPEAGDDEYTASVNREAKNEDDSAYVTGSTRPAHDILSFGPREHRQEDQQLHSDNPIASPMSPTFFHHSQLTQSKRPLPTSLSDADERPAKVPRFSGASECLNLNVTQEATLQFFLDQWAERRRLPTEKEIKDVARAANVTLFKATMWFGDKLRVIREPSPPTSQNSRSSIDKSIHIEFIKNYIADARTRSCARGRATGRYRCTWNCGYATNKRDAWERHEEKKQPQQFWICAACESPTVEEGAPDRPFMTHRPDKFLPHVNSIHPSETNREGLRTRSKVSHPGNFDKHCNFTFDQTGNVCGQAFVSWKGRNDHYISHFKNQQEDDFSDDPAFPQPPYDNNDDHTGSGGNSKGSLHNQIYKDGSGTGLVSKRDNSRQYNHSSISRGNFSTIAEKATGINARNPTSLRAAVELQNPAGDARPCRLFDVWEGLSVPASLKFRYLALKYDSSELGRISPWKSAVSELSSCPNVSCNDGPSTVARAAVQLTREMGFTYLWVDSLEQATAQSPVTTEEIYKAARLIIVIGWSKTAAQQVWHFTCDYGHLDTVSSWTQQRVYFHHVESLGQGASSFVDKVEMQSPGVVAKKPVFARKIVLRDSTKKVLQTRYLEEIEIMQKLNHPHITQFVAAYYDRSAFNILMSPVADCDLRQFLADPDRYPDKRQHLPEWFMSLAEALAYMHKRRCRHKDIKPANILISNNKVLLTDFGTSLDFSSCQSRSSGGAFMTPKYCAPEVAAHQQRGRSSDIFSLGCVFVEMIAVLFNGSLDGLHQAVGFLVDDLKAIYHQRIPELLLWLVPLLASKLNDCQRRVISITRDMLSRQPCDRPTADQVVQKLCSKNGCDGTLNRDATCHCCPVPRPALNRAIKTRTCNGSVRSLRKNLPVGKDRMAIFSRLYLASITVWSERLFLALVPVWSIDVNLAFYKDQKRPVEACQEVSIALRVNYSSEERRHLGLNNHEGREPVNDTSAAQYPSSRTVDSEPVTMTRLWPKLLRRKPSPSEYSVSDASTPASEIEDSFEAAYQFEHTQDRKRKREQELWYSHATAHDTESTMAHRSKWPRKSIAAWMNTFGFEDGFGRVM